MVEHATKPKKPEAEKPSGTERILKDGKLHLPTPPVEKSVKEAAANRAPAKKPDPHKPKDVNVTSKDIVKGLARNIADNRTTKLTELARRNNDVKWLLGEYQRLSKSK
jgi:hypothetical protein